MITLTREQVESVAKRVDETGNWKELEKALTDEKWFSGLAVQQDKLLVAGACYALINEKKEEGRKANATIVHKEGIDYFLHGIMHDKSRKGYIENELSNAGNVVCETGLEDLIIKTKAISQRRGDECRYVLFNSYMRYTLAEKNTESISEPIESPPGDERRIIECNNITVRLEDILLPERHENSFFERILNEDGIDRITLLRSLSQAQFLEKAAKHKGLKEIHGVYGIRHEPGIAYFLRNPEKSLEISERFRQHTLNSMIYPLGSIGLLSCVGASGAMTAYIAYFSINSDKPEYLWAGAFASLSAIGFLLSGMLAKYHITGWNRRRKFFR